MDKQEGINQLVEMYKDREWYHSVGLDQYGRIVVYVHFMNHETLHDIPDNMGKHQVLVHFAGSKTATRDQFVSMPQAPGASFVQAAKEAQTNGVDVGVGQMIDELDQVVGSEEEEKSILYLQKELDKLEKMCSSYTLNDIFYEIQDGKNAVTNMSARYPEVRQRLEKLYSMYGFDVIYEELDG